MQRRNSNVPQWNDTPSDIRKAIKRAEAGVAQLRKLSLASGIERKFTLDGRLVGDIGELIVARHYHIVPNAKPKDHAHDLYAMVHGRKLGVQVKLRREATGKLEFKHQPEVPIVLQFSKDWSRWREVYHGSGSVVARNGITVDKNHRLKKGGRATTLGFSLEELRRQRPRRESSKLAPKLESRS
jgi:hypothetical protein